MRVAIYARYSTDTQDATSIAGQISNCEALCAREGFEIAARYADEAVSGNDDHRPQYQKMLGALEQGDVDAIVCDETSRATRNQAELHRLVAELRFRDQYLITCDGVDTRSEGAEILLSVKAAIDTMESRKIGYRTHRSLRERHKAGHAAGGRIYGYTTVQDGDYRKRVVDPEQAAVVRQIFEWYADGDSAKTVARKLNEAGIPSPSGKVLGWPHTTIIGSKTKASGILRNTIYIGKPAWGKRVNRRRPGTANKLQRRRPESEWDVITDESLRIIPEKLWGRVQKRLNATKRNGGAKGRPPKYLLTGLLKCGSCGASYVVRNGRSYSCSSQTNGRNHACEQKGYIFRPMLERELLAGIKAQLLDDNLVKRMAREIRKRAKRPKRDLSAEIRKVDKQIADVVETLVSVGRSKALTDKLGKLEAQKADLEAATQTADVQPLITNADKAWRKVVGDLENLATYAKPDEVEKARELLAQIIGPVEIREEAKGTFAYVPMAVSGYNGGAEERT